jgi:hypothetical protein
MVAGAFHIGRNDIQVAVAIDVSDREGGAAGRVGYCWLEYSSVVYNTPTDAEVSFAAITSG